MVQNADIDPNTPLGRLSLRARRVPAFIRIPLLFVGLAATLTCTFADLPPYSFFADAQASVMNGEHYYMLSFMLTAAVFMMPIGLTIHFIATFFPELPPVAYPGPAPYGGQAPWHGGQGAYGAPPPAGYPGYGAPSGPSVQPFGQPTYGQPPQAQAPSAQHQNPGDPAQQGPSGQAPWGDNGRGPGPV